MNLADKLFGRFTPVASFVTEFTNGLQERPADFSGTVRAYADGKVTLDVRALRGAMGDNGIVVSISNLPKGGVVVSVETYYFDDVKINYREAKLLARAIEVWIKGAPDQCSQVGRNTWLYLREA